MMLALHKVPANKLIMPIENHEIPPRIKPRLKSAPKIRELFWCDFPNDAQLPELWKTRPVIILSYRKVTLTGAVVVIPCTTTNQVPDGPAFPLKTTIDGVTKAWAICDKPSTVAVSRLTPDKGGIRRLPMEEFNDLLKLTLDWLPKPQ